MTSTTAQQGLVDGKTSSKVINPPGGRSNNIFGDYSDQPADKTAPKEVEAPVAQSEKNDDAQKLANQNKAKSQESSQNRLFGGPDDEDKPCGKGRGQYHPTRSYKGEEWAQYDHPKDYDEEKEENEKSDKGKGAYNPITGEEYEGSPPKAQTPQARVRQPPGGHSSGLW